MPSTSTTQRHPHYAEASDGHVLEEQLFFLAQDQPSIAMDLGANNSADTLNALSVVFGGYERCAPDFAIQRSQYPFYVLEYPLSGSCDLRINDTLHHLSPGQIVGFSPRCAHQYRSDRHNPLSHYFITFTGTDAADLFTRSRLASAGCIDCHNHPQIDTLIQAMIRKGNSNSSQRSLICSHYLRLLLLELSDATPASQHISRSQQQYRNCKAFIDLHFSWLASSQEIAQHCQITVRHLSRLFKQHSSSDSDENSGDQRHNTPQAYLMRLKMHKASVLLRASQASIQSIASTIGFADPYHFSRNFKKTYQLSPSAYRTQTAPTESLTSVLEQL